MKGPCQSTFRSSRSEEWGNDVAINILLLRRRATESSMLIPLNRSHPVDRITLKLKVGENETRSFDTVSNESPIRRRE